MITRQASLAAVVAVLGSSVLLSGQQGRPAARPERKQVLAWADVRHGVQHDSVTRALVTIERLGRESGAYDTYIRTDSQLITKQPITTAGNARPITNKNLDYFDAIFFFGLREIDLTPQQKADLLAFVRDDGKGFVAAHTATTAFFSWPEFGELLGGRFDEHPWNVTEATVIVDDPQFPAMRHFPIRSVIRDEHYQTKDFSRESMRVLARLDPASVDLKNPRVRRTDGDFPVAWAKKYGKGHVFYSTLGHAAEAWDNPIISTMYFEALRWALGLVPGDTTPLPLRTATAARTAVPADGHEWRVHGGDPGAQRFSPLTQITPANVARLQPAWSFDVGSSNLQVTPLVIDGQMYVSGGSTIFAIEPERGTAIWKYEAPGPVSRRGVAYWPGDANTPARLFSGAGDQLVALDARTGAAIESFGTRGYVDLRTGIRGDVDGRFSVLSPPAIYKDLVITGGNNGEQSPSGGLYGDIRAWDARTGTLVWTFHTVPRPGEPGVETWEGESWRNRSGTNVWAFFTVDVERGLLFAPIGSPTSDYYGADRKGKNLYGNSIVALDANTGRLKWYHQLVHHDLWDFDLPAAPTLIDVTRDGKKIPAVAVLTKVTQLFIFDRVTGEPIFGMEERPVPQSTVPGEASWPTQPFPIKPPPLGRVDFDPAKDFYNETPEHAAFCKDLWTENAMYTKGPFTPPGLEGTMVTFPSTLGGGNWNGLSYDPSLGLVFTNVMNLGQVARMQPGEDRSGQTTYVRTTPWGGVGRFWNPEHKIPCSAPPFGELVAVDVNKGEIAWKVPFGVVDALAGRGVPTTGTLSIGGPITTASGLLFVGATIDGRFRAFESKTGRQLWETKLEASAHAIPMTFMGKDNRQYVVVAAGGGSYLRSAPGTKIVAFALPRQGEWP